MGWFEWSRSLVGERFGLCQRLVSSPCEYTQWLVRASTWVPESWLARCARAGSPWCDGRAPTGPLEWRKLRQKWVKDTANIQAEAVWAACQTHTSLCCYQPAKWLCDGQWGINRLLHNSNFPADAARAVSRLLVGGQGLRGGDVSDATVASVHNCCVWCLERGLRVVESLYHVAYVCPEYERARDRAGVRLVLGRAGVELFLIHRTRWSWRELKSIRHFLVDILAQRDAAIGGRRCRARKLQEIAETLW